MQKQKNQGSVGQMIQRCHKWRQKRKQFMDQARQTQDSVERERLLQSAEHFGRQVSAEQGKIDSSRDPKEKIQAAEEINTTTDDEEENSFPDFITNLK